MLTNAGRNILAGLIAAKTGVVPYNKANCYLAVGTSTTGAAAADTILVAEITVGRANIDAEPTVLNNTITFVAPFAAGVGTGAWAENGVFNNSAKDTGTCLTRTIDALGTKSAGAVWVLSKTLTITYA